VQANVSDATVLIDGKKARAPRAGKNFYGIEAGIHTIRVTKENYEPAEQRVDLKKGKVETLPVFELKPIPRFATLIIDGATPDSEVLVDGVFSARVGADGVYRRDDISPGVRAITLRKQEHEERAFRPNLVAGRTLHINGPEVQLVPYGRIVFHISPSNTTIVYRRTDETQSHSVANGTSLSMKAGRVSVTATAPGRLEHRDEITVESGKTIPLEWPLLPVRTEVPPTPAPPVPAPVRRTPDYFSDPRSWSESGPWWVHKSPSVSWLRDGEALYTVEFLKQRANLGIRTKRVEWTILMGTTGRVEYTFDFANLRRRVFAGGKPAEDVRQSVEGGGDRYTLQFEIGPDRIVIRDAAGKLLDTFDRPKSESHFGRFGFKGDVALVLRQANTK